MTCQEVSSPLNPKDFPKVQFWHKQHWIAFSSDNSTKVNSESQHGCALAAQNINVAMQYVKTKDGAVIDGDRATDICCFACTVWLSIAKNKSLPATWGQADIDVRQQYCNEMGSCFPKLRLCDLNWKAEQIATDNYPSWFNNWTSKYGSHMNQKDEDCLVVTKRSRRESTMAVPK